jgi:hypothetical protein
MLVKKIVNFILDYKKQKFTFHTRKRKTIQRWRLEKYMLVSLM